MYKTTEQTHRPKATYEQLKSNQERLYSEVSCEICNRSMLVRDLRQKPYAASCPTCSNKLGSYSRYKNFQHGRLTSDEKQRILKDKTTRRGPFGPGR